MTGWKTGYVCGPEALMSEFRKVHQYNVFCCNTPVQVALAEYMKGERPEESLGTFYQKKRDLFLQALGGSAFEFQPSAGTYFQVLNYKKLSDDEIIRLANMEILAEVTQLDLGENNISDVGVAALCQSPYTKKLKSLNLKSNSITEAGAEQLAKAPNLIHLEQLILKFNRIGEEGAKYLAESEILINLNTLDLFRNRIGEAGAKAIKTSKNFKRVSRIRLD